MSRVKMRAPAGMTGGINGLPGVYIVDGMIEVEQSAVASLQKSGFTVHVDGSLESATTVADLIPVIQSLQADNAAIKAENESLRKIVNEIVTRASSAMKVAFG
ncbi:hypothetical protein [Beijerinckia mobilis]|uniref:hypothetical protein n=1 Tax=Beijerinckia mobilis TaxID=231434 RepID=UPI0005532CD8|nr:hypothetical protein [Beijerinckia mobilis]